MLSSAVATVLAPSWSSRLRRTKKFEGTGYSENRGNLQDVTNTEANRAQEGSQETPTQHSVDRMFTDGSQAQLRFPFLGTRRNTGGWSTKSGPVSLDYEPERKVFQTVSLDVSSGQLDNRKTDAGSISSAATTASRMCPLSFDPNERKTNPQTGRQVGFSSLSSKPTSSSLLLSLRSNSNRRNSNASSARSEPLSRSPSERDERLFTRHISETFCNNNGKDRSNPLLSPSPISYRTTETGLIGSPSFSIHKERDTSKTSFISASPTKNVTPFTQQQVPIYPTSTTESSLSCSRQAYLSRGPSERRDNWRVFGKNTNLSSDSPVSLPQHSSYDSSAVRTHSLPKTTLTSSSWWKKINQEGSSPRILSDTTNNKNKPNTPSVTPYNDNSDFASPSPTNSTRFSSQIPNNRDNNNMTQSAYKGNLKIVVKTQRETQNLKERKAEDSFQHESNRLINQQYGYNLNTVDTQKPQSLPDFLSHSKISIAPGQITLSHPKDLSNHHIRKGSSTANLREIPTTLLHPKISERISDTHYSPHKDPKRFSVCVDTTNTLSTLAMTSKGVYGPPLTQNITRPSLQSHPGFSPTNSSDSSFTGSFSQTPKFPKTAATTRLGFERSYASIPKPLHPNAGKTNYSRASTISTTDSRPATSPKSPLLTPAFALYPLTPPATPINTSPIYADASSPDVGRSFSNSLEKDAKKHRPEKRVRRVTWEDSVKPSEPATVERPDPVPASPVSELYRSHHSIRAPSIFSILRSSSTTTNATPPCTASPKTSHIQMGKEGRRNRSLSSDNLISSKWGGSGQIPTDTMILDQAGRESTSSRQERTQSVDSGTVQCPPATLSLPPDFSNGYKLRYSSPPYSTLISTRSTHGETNNITPRTTLLQKSNYTPQLTHNSQQTHAVPDVTLPGSEPPLSPTSSSKALSPCSVSQTDEVNNNHCKNVSQDRQNSQILLLNNRLDITSQSQDEDTHSSSSTCVTETLVYSIKTKADTAVAAPKKTRPEPMQRSASAPISVETKLSQQSHTAQSKVAAREIISRSSGSSSVESQSLDDEGCNRRMKESLIGKSIFSSVETNSEENPKRSRFIMKKSVSTPNPTLSRSESERVSKSNTKMDQVLNKLRQKFSTRRTDDDLSFLWKWKRPSQTPVSGSSDISSVNDATSESNKTLEDKEQERGGLLKVSEKGTNGTDRAQTKTSLAVDNSMAKDQAFIWPDKSNPETNQEEQSACAENQSGSKTHTHLTNQSPTTHQLDFYQGHVTDYKPTNQVFTCTDPSPTRSPNPSSGYPTQSRKSTPSPRSPFSPFSTISPLSPFPSPEVTDDSVFYSPNLQRRRQNSFHCEPREGISLVSSRRSRASTGPPSAAPGQDKECLASSYADLKYGIEPGRTFSVSSVLSSRPSGPGRISTGSRFRSVGNLSDIGLTCGGTGNDLDQWSVPPDWTTKDNRKTTTDGKLPSFCNDPGKLRSRSLPRSLTRCFANWSSDVSASAPAPAAISKSPRLWSPSMNIHFAWDTAGPPTPPPTPPLSPVSRSMSKPPSLSAPICQSSSGETQDSQSTRWQLPSRGYVSSLSTFDESSDSSSDTTTDDEYYLETGEDEEKETEL